MTTSVTDDRARFEAWAQSERKYNLRRIDGCGGYMYPVTNGAWLGYQAALRSQGEVQGWRPIETAPEGVPCIVGWIDEDGDQAVFDIKDEGCWQEHENLRDHFLSVAPPGSTGPREQAPYTHWMPLPPIPPSDLTAIIGEGD